MFGENDSETSREVLPAGDYGVALTDVSVDVEGSAPRNIPLVIATFEVIGGEHKRTKLWKRFYFSDATARKFLPWQLSILGIKDELDAMECKSHKDTCIQTMGLMGKILGSEYEAGVEVTECGRYNDLVLKSNVVAEIVDPMVPITAPPKEITKEELPF